LEKQQKNKLVILVVGIIALFSLFQFMTHRDTGQQEQAKRPPRPVKTVVLEGGTGEGGRFFPGRVLAAQEVDLAFRVAGNLAQLPVSAGQRVEKGQLLAKLDTRDYEIGLQAAQSELGYARSQLASMRTARPEDIVTLTSQVTAAKARYDEAASNFKRVESLFAEKAIAQADLDRARTSLEVARTSYESARQELQKARTGARTEDIQGMLYHVKALEAQASSARNMLADSELRAPFAGIVASRYVENYQNIRKDEPIVNLQNLSEIEIVVNLPETLLNQARQGQAVVVQVSFESLPGKSFTLSLKEVNTQPDPQTQTYAAKFVMKRPEDILLLPGMTAEVGIFRKAAAGAGEKPTFFNLPSGAVTARQGGTQSVWVLDEKTMTVRSVAVTIVGFQGEKATVTGDLSVGSRIVSVGANFLQEGDPVTLYGKQE